MIRAAVKTAFEVVGRGDALRAQLVVEIRGRERAAGLFPGRVAVEVVAAGLHDQVEVDAAVGRLDVVRDGLHARLLERGVVEIRAAATGLPCVGRHDAVQDQPGRRLGGDAVHAHRGELIRLGAADVQLRAHRRRLVHQGDDAGPARGHDLERLSCQHGDRTARCHIDGRCGRHGHRLFDRPNFQRHIHTGDKSGRQAEAVASYSLKTLERVGHLVGADWQRRESVIALCVAHTDHLWELQGRTCRRDGDAGEDRTAFVRDSTDNAPGGLRLARPGKVWEGEQTSSQRDDDDAEPSTHGSLSLLYPE